MKRITSLILALIFASSLVNYALAENVKVGGSLNYHFLADSIYKDIYGKGNLMFGCSLSYEAIRKLFLRVEANYFQDKGEMTISNEAIALTLIPIWFGIRYRVLEIVKLSPYFGVRVGIFHYRENLPKRFEVVSDSTTGYLFEAGSFLDLTQIFYLDVNIRYIKADVKLFDEVIKLGGLNIGIGIGFQF